VDRPQRSRCASPCPGIRKHTRGHSGPATHGRSLSPAPAGASWGPSPSRLTPARGAYFPVWHPPRLRGSVPVCNAFPRPAHGRSRLCHPGPPCCRLRAAALTAESGRVVRSSGPYGPRHRRPWLRHRSHRRGYASAASRPRKAHARVVAAARLSAQPPAERSVQRLVRRRRCTDPANWLGCQAMFWLPIGSATRSHRSLPASWWSAARSRRRRRGGRSC
jgi:hypothetical protein